MNDTEGELAVSVARRAVEAEARFQNSGHVDLPENFKEKRGVFVTLSTHPSHDLRGCIGYPEPVFSLGSALIMAAQAACHDPRFPPLAAEETDGIVVEVSVLTPPEEIKVADPRRLPEKVKIGEDGLIVQMGPYRGLLLPQVPIEWGWDVEEFLSQTCVKACLTPDCWLDKRTRFFKFQAEIFAEEEPGGRVVRKALK
ncbi:MAG: TIGR00296 family protein [Euryarchaeota archaeon]|nr:TIGR00296 family protein [Euryarchaeota archaeon]